MRILDAMGIRYSVIVEEQEYASYAAVLDRRNLLVLDKAYLRDYDTFWKFPDGTSKGSGPARNFAWDHAVSIGSGRHWIMDDNIQRFYRLNRNQKNPVSDGSIFYCMEDFVLRYTNVAMAGPHYEFFVLRGSAYPPFQLNTRIYSCNLIRNDVPFRWRGRYNEDTDLSIRLLKAGWATVLFNAFLQKKRPTQEKKGGNTDAFYAAEGTLPKSKMLVEMHPDVCKLSYKFNRWHHHADYRPFQKNRLIRAPGVEVLHGTNNYGMTLQPVSAGG